MSDIRAEIAACCKQLKISGNLADNAMTQEGATNQEYLLGLLKSEIAYRRESRIARCTAAAGFPRRYAAKDYRTDEIDFPDGVSFQSLLDLDFYESGKNVVMYGGTGTGKTMLSILIGQEACRRGIPVAFHRTAELVNQFSERQKLGTLTAYRKKLAKAKIIILDEFGYVPYDRAGTQVLYDFLAEIHEQKPVILNTNLEFSQWVNVLYDKRMTTAMIGRLVHHVELVLFPGANNRLKESSINEMFSRIERQKPVISGDYKGEGHDGS